MSSALSSPSLPAAARESGASAARQWNVSGRLRRLTRDSTGRAALFIGLFVALLWAPYLHDFQGRDAAQRQTFPGSEGLRNFELRSLDARFAARGIRLSPSHDKIAIVGIDQNSLGRIGQWPWPRANHARLIDKLHAAGARVIALDFDFSDRQNPGPKGQLSAGDRALIEAATRAGNVITPSLLAPETGANGAPTYQLATPFTADENGNAGLDETTLDLGLAYLPADSDGRFRRYPFALNINGETLGGLAPLSCAIYQGLLDAQKSAPYQAALKRGAWPRLEGGAVEVPLRATQFVGPNAPSLQSTPINFAGPGGTFKTYSYADVLDGYDAASLKQKFEGRIVLVGPTAPLLKDTFASPPFHDVNWAVNSPNRGRRDSRQRRRDVARRQFSAARAAVAGLGEPVGHGAGLRAVGRKSAPSRFELGARAAKSLERARAPGPHL